MSHQKKIKVGVMGVGFVGGSVRNWFEKGRLKNRVQLFLYDKFKKLGSLEEVNKADIIFVCVPTPYGKKGFDLSFVEEALASIPDGKVVVIKSTVLPFTTETLQLKYPKKTILFNPEFLRAKTAKQDFLKPDRQIVGYATGRGAERRLAYQVLDILPKAPKGQNEVVRAREAEMIKYFSNTFLSVRVIFANQLYDICKRADIMYDVVKRIVGYDPRIGTSHFDVMDEGYRGYGGACLPKDTRAMIQFAKQLGLNPKLLKACEEINKQLNGGRF